MSSNSSFSWRAEVAAEIEPATRGGGGGTPLYIRRFDLKTGIHFAHFGLESGGFSREERASMNIFIVSIPNE